MSLSSAKGLADLHIPACLSSLLCICTRCSSCWQQLLWGAAPSWEGEQSWGSAEPVQHGALSISDTQDATCQLKCTEKNDKEGTLSTLDQVIPLFSKPPPPSQLMGPARRAVQFSYQGKNRLCPLLTQTKPREAAGEQRAGVREGTDVLFNPARPRCAAAPGSSSPSSPCAPQCGGSSPSRIGPLPPRGVTHFKDPPRRVSVYTADGCLLV